MAIDAEAACLRQMARHMLFMPETPSQADAVDALVLRGLCATATVQFADGPKTYYRLTDAGWREVSGQ
jgi:hypothetical protein